MNGFSEDDFTCQFHAVLLQSVGAVGFLFLISVEVPS
jgi:hypothetical protein